MVIGLIQLLRSSNLNPSKHTNRALSAVSKPQFQDLFLRLFVDLEPSIQKPPQDLSRNQPALAPKKREPEQGEEVVPLTTQKESKIRLTT